MKKLSVAILSVALSVNSFAGGNDQWVAPLVIGGVVGYIVGNHQKRPEAVRPNDCRTNPQPCNVYTETRTVTTIVDRGEPIYPRSLPAGSPPYGYHFEQEYFNYCNCFKWVIRPD